MLVDGVTVASGSKIENESGSGYAGVYDIAGSTMSKPADGAVLFKFLAPRNFRLPAGLSGSVAQSTTAPNGAVSYAIKKNGTQIGSMDYATGSNSGTFTFSSDVDFAVGDTFSVEAPGTADDSHNGLLFSFSAEVI